jgi:pulcherriminic acid synthase
LKGGVDELVERIAKQVADALPLGEPVDLKEQYAMWVPLLVITELTAIDEAGRFRDWYRLIVAGGISSIGNPGAREAAFAARAELEEFLVPILAERRRAPGDDLVSDLVTAEYDGAPLPDEEIVSMVVLLLSAGVETTERGLASAFAHLARRPEEWDELRARRTEESRIGSFCAETMRYTPPVHGTIRQALEPFELHGVEIAEGDKLLVLLASANRDEDKFPDAQTFDAERFLDNPDRQFTAAGEILPFGAGMHHCAGSRLAEAELVHAIRELLERVERIEPVGELPRSEGLMLHSPPALPVVLRPAGR